MGLIDSPMCRYCPANIDDAGHTFFRCDRWVTERNTAERAEREKTTTTTTTSLAPRTARAIADLKTKRQNDNCPPSEPTKRVDSPEPDAPTHHRERDRCVRTSGTTLRHTDPLLDPRQYRHSRYLDRKPGPASRGLWEGRRLCLGQTPGPHHF